MLDELLYLLCLWAAGIVLLYLLVALLCLVVLLQGLEELTCLDVVDWGQGVVVCSLGSFYKCCSSLVGLAQLCIAVAQGTNCGIADNIVSAVAVILQIIYCLLIFAQVCIAKRRARFALGVHANSSMICRKPAF